MNAVLEEQVLQYLRFEFLGEQRFSLQLLAQVRDPPLLEEGVYEVYAFESSLGAERDYYIVASREAVDSYPRRGLSADDIWAVHVASVVYQRMRITTSLVSGSEDERFIVEAAALVERHHGKSEMLRSAIKLDRVYTLRGETRSADERHAVGRIVGDAQSYFVVGDTPHALYHLDASAHLVWSLHFGHLLLGRTRPST